MRYALITALSVLASLPALPASAQAKKDLGGLLHLRESAPEAARRDPVRDYIEANVTETLYHELAHALIEVLDLPVFGPEEYAADMFSVVLLNRLHSEDEIRRMTPHIIANYMWFAREAGDRVEDLDLWDVHGPDLQRYYTFACLVYGASPATRRELAGAAGIPDERIETCEEEYLQSARAWGAVLDHLATDAPADSLRMDWVTEDSHLSRHVARLVAGINATILLPATVSVSVIPCGQANAYFDPDYTEIQICTELGEELAQRAGEAN